MHYEGKKIRSHNTSYCLVEVVTKACLTSHFIKSNHKTTTEYRCQNRQLNTTC